MVFSRELPHSFAEALKVCREILSSNHDLIRNNLIDTESEQLVTGAHRLATGENLSRTAFHLRLQDRFPEDSGSRLLVLAGQRAEGLPLQHLLGWQTFLSHDYEVNASTLIPRPETEVLVQEAIRVLSSLREGSRTGPGIGIEIGLGTGVISIELLNAFSELQMVASEIVDKAAELAVRNAIHVLGSADRLKVVRPSAASEVLNIFLGKKADFLISNPPYLDSSNPLETEAEVLRHEPASALFPQVPSGMAHDPLYFYREIAKGALQLLKPGGSIFLEIASERADKIAKIFEPLWDIQIISDLTGRPRVLIGVAKSAKD